MIRACAFSGGVDSKAVLHWAIKKYGCDNIHAVIVDHDLREESSEESLLCKSRAESLGVKAVVLKWHHNGISSGVQQKARKARYSLISEYCRNNGISEILTGHHYDDVLESVYMRKDKGYLPMSLGIRDKSYAPVWPEMKDTWLIRPLLRWSKKEMVDYCLDNSLKWVEDPSNQSDKYERNRARKDIFINPSLRSELSDYLESANKESLPWKSYYKKCINSLLSDENSFEIPLNLLLRNKELFGLFIRNAVMCFSSSPSEPSLGSYHKFIKAFERGQRKLSFGGCCVQIIGDKISVTIQKANKGRIQKEKCEFFLDRLSKRY